MGSCFRFPIKYFNQTINGEMGKSGLLRKFSRYLTTAKGLPRLERYAERLEFLCDYGKIQVIDKHTKQCLLWVEFPLLFDPLKVQIRALLVIYWHYEFLSYSQSAPIVSLCPCRFVQVSRKQIKVTIDEAFDDCLSTFFTACEEDDNKWNVVSSGIKFRLPDIGRDTPLHFGASPCSVQKYWWLANIYEPPQNVN